MTDPELTAAQREMLRDLDLASRCRVPRIRTRPNRAER